MASENVSVSARLPLSSTVTPQQSCGLESVAWASVDIIGKRGEIKFFGVKYPFNFFFCFCLHFYKRNVSNVCPPAVRASTIMNLYVPPQSDWGTLMNVSGGGRGGLFLSFMSPPPPPAVKNELSLWYLMFQLCPNFWNARRPLRSSSPGSCSPPKDFSYAEPWLHSLRRHSSHIRPPRRGGRLFPRKPYLVMMDWPRCWDQNPNK